MFFVVHGEEAIAEILWCKLFGNAAVLKVSWWQKMSIGRCKRKGTGEGNWMFNNIDKYVYTAKNITVY